MFFCLLACVVPLAAAQPPTPSRDVVRPSGSATIRGRVFIDGTDHALPRTQVLATSEHGQTFAATTEADGRYEIKQLPAGSYTVSASRLAYVPQTFGQRRPNGVGTRIPLTDGQTVTDIDLKLVRAGVLTGRIVDELGDPVPDVQVSTLRMFYMNGRRDLRPSGRSTISNDLGEFRLFGLPPGSYYVSAVYRSPGGDTNDRVRYGATYYPGTGNVAQAQRIAVAAGQTIAGMNFTLLPIRAVRVAGTARDSAGRPLAGAFVSTIDRAFTGSGGGATVRPDGTFTISAMAPGDYVLRAGLPGAGETAIMPLTVGDSDIDDVQLIARKPSTIRGRVVFDDSAPRPKESGLSVFAQPDIVMTPGGNARVKDDYSFETNLPAGRFRLSVFMGEWRVRSVRVRDVEVLDSGFDVPIGGSVDDIVVELTTRHADLSGKVIDASGAEARDYTVVLFTQDSQRWGSAASMFSARPGVDGSFKLKLPGGEYFAAAVEDLEMSAIDPEVLEQLREHAQKVTVADGQTRSMVVTLSPPVVY